jgi:hypothetical protein
MKLTTEQIDALVEHVYQQHKQGQIDWRRTVFPTSFQANMETGTTLFCSVYMSEATGKVTSMPLNVTHGSQGVALPPNDPKLVKIGQDLAEKWLHAAKDESKSFLDAVLGASVRRDKRITQLIGDTPKESPEKNPQDNPTLLGRLKAYFS